MQQANLTTTVAPGSESLSADISSSEAGEGRFYPALQLIVGVLIVGSSHTLYALTAPIALVTIAMGLAVGVSGLRQLLKY